MSIYFSTNRVKPSIIGVDFSAKLASKIHKLPRFFTILENNITRQLGRREEAILLEKLRPTYSHYPVQVKIKYNFAFNTIRVLITKKNNARCKKNIRQKNEDVLIDFILANSRLGKKIEELVITISKTDLLDSSFPDNLQDLYLSRITINTDDPKMIQRVLGKIPGLTAEKELTLKINSLNKSSVYNLDFMNFKDSEIELLVFQSNVFFNLKKFNFFTKIRNIKLCNANLENYNYNSALESITLTGNQELPNGTYILPGKFNSLTIDSSILSKIQNKENFSAERLDLHLNKSREDLLSPSEINTITDIVKHSKDLKQLSFSNDCSVLKAIFKELRGLKTLTIKNPTTFRNEPTGKEEGFKELEELILDEPWFIRVPQFIENLKKLRYVY